MNTKVRGYFKALSYSIFSFTYFIVVPIAAAEDQCESVLRYAGTDETIVTSEVQRIRNFISDFCSSNESTRDAYNNASQGLKIGFKGFGLGGSSSSDSHQLDHIKQSLCNNQQQATSDYEKAHKEIRRATREAISAWDACMSRHGLVAKGTVSGEKTVVVVMIFRPNSIGEVARVSKPYEAEGKTHCEFVGDPALMKQDTFTVGPAGVSFVCRRVNSSDRMTIVLSADKALINGISPIQVEPYQTNIQITPPKVAGNTGGWHARLIGTSCATVQMPPPGGSDYMKRTCTLENKKLTCAVTGSPNPSHPIFTHQAANNPIDSFFQPPPYWGGNQQIGPFKRMYAVFEVHGQIDNEKSVLAFRPIVGFLVPPNVFGIRAEPLGKTDFQETSFVSDQSGTPINLSSSPYGPPVIWRKCG